MDKAEEDVLKWFGHKERVSEKEVDKKKKKKEDICVGFGGEKEEEDPKL